MKNIRLILDTKEDSIGYSIDVEKMTYTCGGFDKEGGLVRVDESGEIFDSALLAKRLYLVIKAALNEQATVAEPQQEPQNAVE